MSNAGFSFCKLWTTLPKVFHLQMGEPVTTLLELACHILRPAGPARAQKMLHRTVVPKGADPLGHTLQTGLHAGPPWKLFQSGLEHVVQDVLRTWHANGQGGT